jgi:phosphoenolpyruvate carboxykinase (diphosphate)
MDLKQKIGLSNEAVDQDAERRKLHLYIDLKLASCGQPTCINSESAEFMAIANDLLLSYLEKNRQLATTTYYPADQRIQDFLNDYFADLGLEAIPSLPTLTFELDRHGVARELSLPIGEDEFKSEIVSSYRVKQGVLHNPASDRRTTKGSFHIAEGGLPVPGDKKEVPKVAFANMLAHAVNPPESLLTLPFTANQTKPARMFASLLLRPIVCPSIPGIEAEKSMEIRFFAPGNLVSNLDFVESIFGNGGNPALPEYDAALDIEHWTGHTGCVILAPHLTKLTKKELGLPHWDDASERQRHDEMCWQSADELYNDGQAFKLTARDRRGVIVTLIADNYYGYCKKEVKTQISYAANLYGLAEEEHAGGALAFQRFNHGDEFGVSSKTRETGYDFDEMISLYGEIMDVKPEGYAIDKRFPQIVYVQQDLRMNLNAQTISWQYKRKNQILRLQPEHIYVQPNGYKIEMQKHPGAPSFRIVGTAAEGTFCHKPCTVSGGGKSEISKSIEDAVIFGPLFVDDLKTDLDRVQEIFDKDYTDRFLPGFENEDRDPARKPLSSERSLGSVIKLLTPSPSHKPTYNDWLNTIQPSILALVFLIKRFYREEWGNNWRDNLAVDVIDGAPGHELKLGARKIVATYLRIGFDLDGNWRTFKVRQDYLPAEKVQMEDDISASVVVPSNAVARYIASSERFGSVKLVQNCEYRLFQRPDDAIIPGYDKQTEKNMSAPGNFMANFEPLDHGKLSAVVENVLSFSNFTKPMHDFLSSAYADDNVFTVSSAHPRLVDGKPSKNPRYLETRVDLIRPMRKYLAETGARFHRKIPLDMPVSHPVDAVLTGRRNNPPEPGIRSLAVYNPIHYQELPELFMDFVCSLTGKSPSTTGAGSEGALTKGPFNALRPTADLNNTLVSYILTGYPGFSSSAGHIGPDLRVDHDVSLLIPEIWARLKHEERQPAYLIEHRFLEPVEDFEFNGQQVLGSRLGYRITSRFVHGLLGKIFDNPSSVFTSEILRPETQDLAVFADGVNNIVETQQRVAQQYIDDGSINDACPPLYALLHIMATGQFEGKDVHHPEIRNLFSKDYLLSSDWYQERLEIKQQREIKLWLRHTAHLQKFLTETSHQTPAAELHVRERLEFASNKLEQVESDAYLNSLIGTIGADPLAPPRERAM